MTRCAKVGLWRVILACVGIAIVASACSTKKNTPTSRAWQAFTTRYNVYFNGSEHYKETLKDMEDKYQDDYTRFVLTHPADARQDTKMPQPTGDFKRTIEKMQKAIQLHSISKKPAKKSGSKKEKAFRSREEFNPFLHNAWLMLGRAQYFNGDFSGASGTFYYISKHFFWLPNVVTEALLWQARSYCALGWKYEAESVLKRIKPARLTTKSLKNLYDFVMADYYVLTEEYKEAIPYLSLAAKSAKGSQKNRLYFLLGQIYQHLGQNAEAYEAFKRAGKGASTDYRTKFNARIKQSEVYTGTNIKKEVNSLKGMARYQRNKEFQDQIYYAIGNLYLSRKDTAEAKKYYIEAVKRSTRHGIDEALANLALGNLYFEEGDYAKAQPCYSSAVPQLSDKYPNYKMLKRRSDVLDELATYSQNVTLQDSLLDLSKLPEEEQMKVCQRLADELKKREKEEADAARLEQAREQAEANKSANQQTDATQSFTMNTSKDWYFYNDMVKQTGKTEFQRKWGSRKLEDNWRRRNKNSFSFDDEAETNQHIGEEAEATQQTADSIPAEGAKRKGKGKKEEQPVDKANDPHYAEYYYKSIPHTPEEVQTSNDVIMEGLYNMGVILKDKLEDYTAARKEFNRLDTRYPDNIYRLDAYYNLYLMAVRENDTAQAERYRQLIMKDFPDSPYGKAMEDPDYFNKLREMNVRQEALYAEAYADYLADHNTKVHEITEQMEKDYPLSRILPKFVFIDALSYLTDQNYDKFRERLEYLLEKWPDTDMTEMASSIVKGLKEGRKPAEGATTNTRGMIWETRLAEAETQQKAEDGQPANFERDPNKPQFFVLAFPRDSVNSNQLLYDVARFNFTAFTVLDFDLELKEFGNIGMVVVKGFNNLREAEQYRSLIENTDLFRIPESARPIIISQANFELLLREGRSFEEYFRFEEKAATEQVEEDVVGPDNTMPPPPEGATNPDDDTPPQLPDEEGDDQQTPATEPATEPESEATESESEAVTETPAESQTEATEKPD